MILHVYELQIRHVFRTSLLEFNLSFIICVNANEISCRVLELGTLHGIRQLTGTGSQKGDKTRV